MLRALMARELNSRDLLWWTATLLAFPLAGLAARGLAGPVDAVWAAVLAGAVAGLVIGVAQWLALHRIGADARWIAATAAVSPLASASGTRFSAMAIRSVTCGVGAVSGLGIGTAQWWLLRGLVDGSLAWIPASAAAWALGWTVTTAIGVDPDDRWPNPGLSGAATLTVVLGAVLWLLARSGLRDPTSA